MQAPDHAASVQQALPTDHLIHGLQAMLHNWRLLQAHARLVKTFRCPHQPLLQFCLCAAVLLLSLYFTAAFGNN